MNHFYGSHQLWRDVLYAFRSSARKGHRLITFAIVLIVGLGIGTATSVFSIVDALLIRGLPFPAAEQLVDVELTTARERGSLLFGHAADVGVYEAWRRDAADTVQLAGFQVGTATLTGESAARPVQVVGITSNAITLLGVRPLYGREFLSTDDARGAVPSVMLSHPLWTELFGADATAIGRRLTLNGRDCRIIGVMPRGFHVPLSIPEARQNDAELWLALGGFQDLFSSPTEQFMPLEIIGRMRPGISVAAVQARLDPIAKSVIDSRASAIGGDRTDVTRVIGLREAVTRSVRIPILLLSGAVGLLLLLACLNVANLLMVKTLSRDRELATRVALGAAPSRLVLQLITEGLVVTLLGGLLGVGFAVAATPALLDLGASYLPDVGAIAINMRALLFSLGITLVSGVAVSAWPAATALNRSPIDAMTSRTPAGRPAIRRWMRALVVVELALSILVLTSMGLLGRSFIRLTDVSRGYDVEKVVVAGLVLRRQVYASPEARRTFRLRLLDELRHDSAVAFPAISSGLPIIGGTVGMVLDGDGSSTAKGVRMAIWSVAGDYFRSLGVPILHGNQPNLALNSSDVAIDAAAARLLFGHENAIGRRIVWGAAKNEGVVTAIVGDIQELNVNVATNSKYRAMKPHIYVGVTNDASAVVRISARATGNPVQALNVVRETIARIDRDIPLSALDTMKALVGVQLARERFLFVIVALLAAMSVMLASAGIFAVMAHSTTQRTHEIGVRLAVGARPSDILFLILGESLVLTGAGAIIGILAASAFSGILRSVLFEISPFDPLTVGGVVGLTALIALLASALPAFRAASVSATVSLLGQQ